MGLLNKLFDLRVLVALNLRQVVQIVQIFVLWEAILVNECYFLWINLIVDLHLVILELIRVNGTIFKWLWLIVQQWTLELICAELITDFWSEFLLFLWWAWWSTWLHVVCNILYVVHQVFVFVAQKIFSLTQLLIGVYIECLSDDAYVRIDKLWISRRGSLFRGEFWYLLVLLFICSVSHVGVKLEEKAWSSLQSTRQQVTVAHIVKHLSSLFEEWIDLMLSVKRRHCNILQVALQCF